jgi:hypothetical protein
VFEVFSFLAVHFAHLLQAHDVGIQLLNSVPQIVNFQPFARPNALHTLVNVVGGNAKDVRV